MSDAPAVPARPTRLAWLGWGVCGATATVAAGTGALMLGAFSRPHAFGARDGQGAAGLAALLLLVAFGVALVAEVAALFLASRLRRGGVRWAFPATVVSPALASSLGFVLGLVG